MLSMMVSVQTIIIRVERSDESEPVQDQSAAESDAATHGDEIESTGKETRPTVPIAVGAELTLRLPDRGFKKSLDIT